MQRANKGVNQAQAKIETKICQFKDDKGTQRGYDKKKEMCVHMSKSNMQVKASGEGEVYAEQEAKPKAKATG